MISSTRIMRSSAMRSQMRRCMSTWESLVHSRTPDSQRQEFASVDNVFAKRRSTANAVPKEVKAIDWDYWMNSIDDKDVVAKIKAEYESMTFPSTNWSGEADYTKKMDDQIAKAEKWQGHWQKELQALKVKIDQCDLEAKTIHNWTLKDWYKSMPGIEEELREQANQNDWLPSNDDERLYAHDAKELIKAIKEGSTPPPPVIEFDEVDASDPAAAEITRMVDMQKEYIKDFPSGYPTANPQ